MRVEDTTQYQTITAIMNRTETQEQQKHSDNEKCRKALTFLESKHWDYEWKWARNGKRFLEKENISQNRKGLGNWIILDLYNCMISFLRR